MNKDNARYNSRVAAYVAVENKKYSSHSPTSICKCQGFREHANSKQYGDRVEELASIAVSVKNITYPEENVLFVQKCFGHQKEHVCLNR